MATTRKRTYVDLASVKRSRKNYVGGITRARETLLSMVDLNPSALNLRKLTATVTAIDRSENGFYSTIDEAQTFIAEGEEQEDRQMEEDEATETFESSVLEARELGESLLRLANIRRNLDDFKIDLASLQALVQDHPDQPHHAAVEKLENTHHSIRQEWKQTDLEPEHSLKNEIDVSKGLLTKLASEVAGQTETRATTSLHPTIPSRGSSSTHEGKRDTKLPTIEVPTFHGDIMAWAQFWSAFQDTVGSREDLSDTAKLIYLRKAIRCPDTQLLLNSPQETPDSYSDVVKVLVARFDKTKQIHRKLVHNILQLGVVRETQTEIRKLVDVVNSIISALKRTAGYTAEAILTSIIYWLIPSRLQTLWEQHTKKEKKVAPIEDFLDYLSEHAETLPPAVSNHSPKSDPSDKKHRKPDKRQDTASSKQRHNIHVASSSTPPSTYKWDCPICKPEKHPIYHCQKWLSYSVAQRLTQVQTRSLCSNCLADGHSTSNCKSTYRCKECHQKHHTSLHQTAPPTPVNSSVLHPSQVPDALMMTVKVNLTGPGGQQVQARALIDPGAGISLVSSRIAQRLQLPLVRRNIQFTGVQGTPCKSTKHVTHFALSPVQASSPHLTVSAAVVPVVTNDLPTQDLSHLADLPHLATLDLADPGFHTPGRIDLILGAEVFPKVILNQPMVKGDSADPVCQSTIFGWAVI